MRIKSKPSKTTVLRTTVLSNKNEESLLLKREKSLVLDCSSLLQLRDLYCKLYAGGIPYPAFVRRRFGQKRKANHIGIDAWAQDCKDQLRHQYKEKFLVHEDKVQETGEYFYLDIFEPILPLIPDHLYMEFCPFTVCVFKDGTYEVTRLPSFFRWTNQKRECQMYSQELFGVAFNMEKTFHVNGLRKLAELNPAGSNCNLKLVTLPRSIIINLEEGVKCMDTTKLSPTEILECGQKWNARDRRGEALNYLVMELSNEDHIVFKLSRGRVDQVKSINAVNKVAVSRYFFFSGQKEVSPSSSSASSGYSSLSDSSACNDRASLTVECDVKNSCVICGAVFPSATDLFFHLEFRYPKLSFGYDHLNPSEVTIKLNPSRITDSTAGETVNLSRKNVVAERSRFFAKVGLDMKKSRKRKNFNTVTKYNLPFNMPSYHCLPGDLYGVETPTQYLNTLNARRITEFGDVNAEEKDMMMKWNAFVNKRENRVVSEKTGSQLMRAFTRQHSSELLSSRGVLQFLSHCSVKYMRHEVNNEAIKDCLLHIVEEYEASGKKNTAISRSCNANRSRKIKSPNKNIRPAV
ncbi:unnamed protein product [Bursaphelenchus xylophilus]|uniref:(pine wood nematode) hypothetical protein n=1 Tax=Bursaphelenchus xylophilus TaxID=6326 RepID=A0A7I8XHP7_BURXY|nr:unnamed protein product [Bursaphelenchus xylophilus]CAG9084644.1 unnamed protein product [Bursaphelenchus xylophilus]